MSTRQLCVCVTGVSCLLVMLLHGGGDREDRQILRVYDDFSTDVVTTIPEQQEFSEEELVPADKLDLPSEDYRFHSSCNCSRYSLVSTTTYLSPHI